MFDYTAVGVTTPPKWCGKTGLRDSNLPTNHYSRIFERTDNVSMNIRKDEDRGPTSSQSGDVIKRSTRTSKAVKPVYKNILWHLCNNC